MKGHDFINSILGQEFDYMTLISEIDQGGILEDNFDDSLKQIYFSKIELRTNPISKKNYINRTIEKLNDFHSNISTLSGSSYDTKETVKILIENLIGELEKYEEGNDSIRREKMRIKGSLTSMMIATDLLKNSNFFDSTDTRYYQWISDNFIQENGNSITVDSLKAMKIQIKSSKQYQITKDKISKEFSKL